MSETVWIMCDACGKTVRLALPLAFRGPQALGRNDEAALLHAFETGQARARGLPEPTPPAPQPEYTISDIGSGDWVLAGLCPKCLDERKISGTIVEMMKEVKHGEAQG
jgi:hypothetical protein